MTTRPRRVTIDDVAREAEVAKSTVSRALNRPGRLNHETQQRIQRIADQLGYHPDPALRMRGHGTLALLVPDISNPFFLGIIRGAEHQAAAGSFHLILADSESDPDREEGIVSTLATSVDGFVMAYTELDPLRIRQLAPGRPMVVVNRQIAGLSSVVVDPLAGPTIAVDHLASLGHREIAYVAGPEASWTDAQRWATIGRAASARGMVARRLGPFPPVTESGAGAADAALAEGVTAVIAFNDLIAIGMLLRLAERGVSVPRELSIMGFDDIFGANFCSPSLTTMAAPLAQVGSTAVRLLVDGLHEDVQPKEIVLPAHLVVRESTGPVPGPPRTDWAPRPARSAARL